ncbi:MAG: DNA repair protein RecN [Lachnospiraceae bacterium]|nr:DNA repair protein RecN [Lachnospiraceae bacterium]
MLLSLTVDNLALITHEEIEFGSGLNILTGETGAGKSILLGALGLSLGGKADHDMVRDPSKPAMAEAVFSVEDPKEVERLRAMEVEPYDGQVILSRKMNGNRTVAKINGETVPSVKLTKVGNLLLDIYGQHEHESLQNKKKQLALLDEYASTVQEDHHDLLDSVTSAYRDYQEASVALEHAKMDESDRVREASFLEHEIREIEEANLKAGEDRKLEDHYRRMKNSEKIAEGLHRAESLVTEDRAASDLVGQALGELNALVSYDPEGLTSLQSSLSDIDSLLSDFSRDLLDYEEAMEFDPEDFRESEERLDLVNHLKMLYGNTIEAIQDALEEKKKRMEELSDYDAYLSRLTRRFEKAQSTLKRACDRLTEARKKAAEELTIQVTEALKDLNFLDSRFTMRFQAKDWSANGQDDCEFYISMNPGEPLRPLKDTASGGELSRIMLAIKTVLAEEDHIDSLIFDEIDTGISGRTAQKVSEKLAELAIRHQVICITHLPQIASFADRHFLVEKKVEKDRTMSSIRILNQAEEVNELSRMLGGSEITDTVRQNAAEMLDLAEKTKEKRRKRQKP